MTAYPLNPNDPFADLDGFTVSIDAAKQRADVAFSLHFEVHSKAISVTMNVAAFVVQSFVSMSSVELVLFLDDHVRNLPGIT